jgi:hypothetical protein
MARNEAGATPEAVPEADLRRVRKAPARTPREGERPVVRREGAKPEAGAADATKPPVKRVRKAGVSDAAASEKKVP